MNAPLREGRCSNSSARKKRTSSSSSSLSPSSCIVLNSNSEHKQRQHPKGYQLDQFLQMLPQNVQDRFWKILWTNKEQWRPTNLEMFEPVENMETWLHDNCASQVQHLGRGSYGTVLSCHMKPTLRDMLQMPIETVAVKVQIVPESKGEERLNKLAARISMENEVPRLLQQQCESTHSECQFVKVYGQQRLFLVEPREYAFISILQLVKGGTAKDLFVKQIKKPTALTFAQYTKNFCELALTLQALHSLSLVHSDIKPDNLFYDRQTQLLKLADFGMTCIVSISNFQTEGNKITTTTRRRRRIRSSRTDRASSSTSFNFEATQCLKRLGGSPIYFDPWVLDQPNAEKRVFPWSDMYSFGVSMFEIKMHRFYLHENTESLRKQINMGFGRKNSTWNSSVARRLFAELYADNMTLWIGTMRKMNHNHVVVSIGIIVMLLCLPFRKDWRPSAAELVDIANNDWQISHHALSRVPPNDLKRMTQTIQSSTPVPQTEQRSWLVRWGG